MPGLAYIFDDQGQPRTRHVNDGATGDLRVALSVTRFWSLVDTRGPDECWPWLGDTDKDGYGIFVFDKKRQAPSLAVAFSTGEQVPPGMETLHSCDNPPCCNPRHLRYGTRTDNVRDMQQRQRGSRYLPSHAVQVIRERRAGGAVGRALAAEYGVTESVISNIIRGSSYPEVSGPIKGKDY